METITTLGLNYWIESLCSSDTMLGVKKSDEIKKKISNKKWYTDKINDLFSGNYRNSIWPHIKEMKVKFDDYFQHPGELRDAFQGYIETIRPKKEASNITDSELAVWFPAFVFSIVMTKGPRRLLMKRVEKRRNRCLLRKTLQFC